MACANATAYDTRELHCRAPFDHHPLQIEKPVQQGLAFNWYDYT